MSEWRDIESAPKDGTEFLAYWDHGKEFPFMQPMKWSEAHGNFIITWDHDNNVCPEMWQPLPEPPK